MLVEIADLEPEGTMPHEEGRDTAGAIGMQVDVAVLKSKVDNIDKKLDSLITSVATNLVTKPELSVLADEVKSLKANQSWIVKGVIGAVLVAILSLVLYKGGMPPR